MTNSFVAYLNGTLGLLIIVSMISSALYGITLIQTYIYFHQRNKDPAWFRGAVVFLWTLDTLHQAWVGYVVYTYSVTDYANVLSLQVEPWEAIGIIVASALMNTGVRSLFCVRIWRLSGKSWPLITVIMLCSFTEFGALIAFATQEKTKIHLIYSNIYSLAAEFYIVITCSIVSDSLIAISQVILLRKHRTRLLSNSRIKFTIRTLIIYSINTGLFTSFCALFECIALIARPNNDVFLAIFLIIPTIFLNALLANLNARHELKETTHENGNVISVPLPNIAPSTATMGVDRSTGSEDQDCSNIPIEIKIERSDLVV